MNDARLISASIDVTKISKDRLIIGKKQREDGSVGKYMNVTFQCNDAPDQHGNNVSIWEGQSQEERANKTPRNFLGNGKIVWSGQNTQGQQQQDTQQGGIGQAPQSQMQEDEDLPF